MRKESQILNTKNCTTTRWLYRSKTVVACGVASLALRWVPLFAQTPDVVVQWNDAVLQGMHDSKIGPPMVAPALFILHNCLYDAWAAYDRTAVGTVFGPLCVSLTRIDPSPADRSLTEPAPVLSE